MLDQVKLMIMYRNFLWYFAIMVNMAIMLLAMLTTTSIAIELPTRGICAHRGGLATHPENTLAAFKEAIRLGAHQIEFDVRQTSDGSLVIMHDDLLIRTTNVEDIFPDRKNNSMSSFTLAELKLLDAGSWKGSRFAGERIPTLTETLAIMPRNVWLNVHLKGKGADFAESVAKVVLGVQREQQAFLSVKTPHLPGIERAERHSGKNILTCNMNIRGTGSNYVDQTIYGGYDFLQFNGKGVPLSRDIARLKEHGIRINFFGTDDANTLKDWLNKGIDFPLVNNTKASMGIAKNLGIKPLTPINCPAVSSDKD